MSLISRLCQNLRYLRKHSGITQQQFAEIAKFETRYYQRIESGARRVLQTDTLERLASVYGLEAWELIAPDIDSRVSRLKPKLPSKRK